MMTTAQKIETAKAGAEHIADLLAGVESFLGDMNSESKTYRMTLIVNCIASILDDLQADCIATLAGVLSDMEGDAA